MPEENKTDEQATTESSEQESQQHEQTVEEKAKGKIYKKEEADEKEDDSVEEEESSEEEAPEKEDKEEKEEGKEKKKPVPEKYELKISDDTVVTSEQLKKIETYAKARGFSQEEAQELLDQTDSLVKESVSDLQAQQMAAFEEMSMQKWPEAVKADEEIAGKDGENLNESVEMAKRVVSKFGTKELLNMLDPKSAKNPEGLGYGNHPEVVRVFARIGRAMSEDQLIHGNAGTKPKKKTIAQKIYGPKKEAGAKT